MLYVASGQHASGKLDHRKFSALAATPSQAATAKGYAAHRHQVPDGPIVGGVASGKEIARAGAFLIGARSTEGAEHAVEGGIADAEPVLLADEMVAQMVLLDPAANYEKRRQGQG